MHDLHKALADIGDIRQQVARGTMFRGFGPVVLAATGMLALITAAVQSAMLGADPDPLVFLIGWVATAVVAAALVGVEMVTRSRRHHASLADAMIMNAVEHFLPAGAAGAALCFVVLRFAPDAVWMLPGLWQLLVGVGILASLRFLPRTVAIAGAFYFVAGIAVLVMSSETRALSPWTMGLPFAIGQIMLGAILHIAYGGQDEEAR